MRPSHFALIRFPIIFSQKCRFIEHLSLNFSNLQILWLKTNQGASRHAHVPYREYIPSPPRFEGKCEKGRGKYLQNMKWLELQAFRDFMGKKYNN